MTNTNVVGVCKVCGLEVERDRDGDLLHIADWDEFEKEHGPHSAKLEGEPKEPAAGWNVTITYQDGTTKKTRAAGVYHLPAALERFAGSEHGDMVRIVCE